MTPPALSRAARRLRPGLFAELQTRIDAHTATGGSLVPFHIGDTVRPPPDTARFTSACADESTALYRYGATNGLGPLREAIASRVGAVDAEREVLVAAGATHAASCASRALFDPGDEVLLPTPYWPLAPGVIETSGAIPIELSLHPIGTLAERLDQAWTPRARGLYLTSPNNPDGTVLPAKTLAEIASVVIARDGWAIADEVYSDFVFDGVHTPFASVGGMRERTVTLGSFSKSHALAGARVGYAIGPSRVIAPARRVAVHTTFNVPVISQRSALAALEHGDAWMAAARDEYRTARDVALDALQPLRAMGVTWRVPAGATYVFLDFASALHGRTITALLEAMIDHGVLLAPGEGFGAAHGTCARLCYSAVELPVLRDGIARMIEAVTP